MSSDIEETMKCIQAHKGVQGLIVLNMDGVPVRTTMDNSTTVQYASLFYSLSVQARNCVRDIDPQNDLTFLRIRSRKHEIMIAPERDYTLIVVQNPSEWNTSSYIFYTLWTAVLMLQQYE